LKKIILLGTFCFFSFFFLCANSISTIIIDPGHGGKDPGALGELYQEKEINLKLALNLQENLTNLMPEKKVLLTRASDSYISLKDRVKYTQQYKDSIFISLHTNSSTVTSAKGYEIFYTNKLIKNKDLAQTILEKIESDFQFLRNRGLKIGNYYVLNTSKVPSVLIEIGFISNEEEEKIIGSSAFLLNLSQTIAEAITSYCLEN